MSEFFDKDIESGKQEEDSTYHYSYVEEDSNVEHDPNVEYVEEVIEEVVEEEPKKEKRKPKKKRKPMSEFTKKLTRMAAYGLVFGLVGGAAFQGVSYGLNKVGIAGGNQKQLATTQTVSTSSGSKSDVSAVAESVLPSIVSITGTFQTNSYGFFGRESSQESEGSGSGIIVGKDSHYLYIATNNHVVEDATSLAVGFCDDSTVEAEIKGTDSDADLAVVTVDLSKIKSSTLEEIKIITMGDSDKLNVGEQAIAIGNALGYGQSVTAGYISALNREVQLTDKTMTLIQTDAAINPGNSGGALLDGEGKLMGINTVKYSSEEVEGMGYAIPINTAKPIIESLINEETIPESKQAYLGITGGDMTEDMANAYGMPTGIYVSEIQQNSPAQKAGMQAGDVIVEFDGSSVTTMENLQNKLEKKSAGTKVTIKVKRQSQMGEYKDVTLNVTLGSKQDAQ
ncbi:trypsin [Anaerostipes sp. 992a]|uniref:S1C family serine protease n=1 Tax=Anaerostipes sp. 992a TaxID=1261637 RepID=UPI000952FD0E|nr:trypsin-like peptidase domain-containing protein [Anaerostipes sp. 992a]OLR62792.1 trypsin [Anaerostipes sp. 992a]